MHSFGHCPEAGTAHRHATATQRKSKVLGAILGSWFPVEILFQKVVSSSHIQTALFRRRYSDRGTSPTRANFTNLVCPRRDVEPSNLVKQQNPPPPHPSYFRERTPREQFLCSIIYIVHCYPLPTPSLSPRFQPATPYPILTETCRIPSTTPTPIFRLLPPCPFLLAKLRLLFSTGGNPLLLPLPKYQPTNLRQHTFHHNVEPSA